MRLLKVFCLLLLPALLPAQHPLTFFTAGEAAEVSRNLNKYPLLTRSFTEIKNETDLWLNKEVDVPVPKDPAGGYTHDRHKANYTLMFNAGILYNLTHDLKYARLARDIFLKYAVLNPTLKNHPEATSNSPGHLFWQALNDANWLVYAGMAYDLIYNSLSPAERKTIEEGAFKPEVDFITKDLRSWFDLIHNHGVWACAGVGIVGIATNNKDYVDMALYGSKKDGESGFIAQMDGLFAPDGYYTEGPYYVRYAILPYYLFAAALHHARPALKIFEYRNRILQKALLTGLEQTNLDGTFFALNDALKEKDYTTNELVTAIDLAWSVYGKDNGLLVVAKKQGKVLLNPGGVSIAAAISANPNIPEYYPYKTVEYTDGVKGDEGGVSLLRNGKNKNLTTLIFKYTSHGLSHGHYDRLNLNLYDKGNEILTDYGAVRFVGIEQKYGGRYLPENKSYAAQTIAHNSLVVDERSDFDGKESEAVRYHPVKLFSDLKNPALLVVSAREDNAYKGVRLQRSVYLLQLPGGRKLIADILNANSDQDHQYDLPFHFDGAIINTSFKYKPATDKLEPLGNKNGYQFLWKEAEADIQDTIAQLTFLKGTSYYSISTLITGKASLYITRSGANDPDFNLRHEPALIIRKKGKDQAFINVVEIHGNYDAVNEFSSNSYPAVKRIHVVENDENFSIINIEVDTQMLVIAQSNTDFQTNSKHNAGGVSWTGPYAAWYGGKQIN
jgi:hypothetical protein